MRSGFQCSSASRKFLNRALLALRRRVPAQVSVLFSEPKIPQFINLLVDVWNGWSFSALQRAENSSIVRDVIDQHVHQLFQCSSASRKFLNRAGTGNRSGTANCFSALQRAENSSINHALIWNQCRYSFSALQRAENSSIHHRNRCDFKAESCFSALQRAENSSIDCTTSAMGRFSTVSVLFSEPKIPQCRYHARTSVPLSSFSALQRAENSSIDDGRNAVIEPGRFQCSSASRKFLNRNMCMSPPVATVVSFSALQRAENSSIDDPPMDRRAQSAVSVLFSEPKIPQSALLHQLRATHAQFQCSSASRKFLNRVRGWLLLHDDLGFQCSSASRKFLNRISLRLRNLLLLQVSVLFSEPKIPQFPPLVQPNMRAAVSVLFSEPKIPQCNKRFGKYYAARAFQCSSASRKFLNPTRASHTGRARQVSVLFSEPKIPQ